MDTNGLQRKFFQDIFGNEECVVRLATRTKDMKFSNALYSYPSELDDILSFVSTSSNNEMEVYFSPDFFKLDAIHDKKATKDYVYGSRVIPVDFDGNAPQDMEGYTSKGLPEPSIIVQSSDESHKHVYWVFDEPIRDIPALEAQRRVFTGKTDGDNSGWDAGGLFRVPGTINYGYGKDRPAQEVLLEESNDVLHRFSSLPVPTKKDQQDIVFASLTRELSVSDPPALTRILASHTFSDDFQTVFFMDASETTDRSRSLVRLANASIESGLSDVEALVILEEKDKEWKKYTRRSVQDRLKLYAGCIERARLKQSQEPEVHFRGVEEDPKVSPKTTYNLLEVSNFKVEIEWYFAGFLATTGYALLTGPPGVGKTQQMLRIAEAVTMGWGLYGWQNTIQRKGRVLIFSMEMDVSQIKYFTDQMQMDVESIYKDYIIYHDQEFLPLDDEAPGKPGKGQKTFEFEINKHRPDLVFIDSLSKVIRKSPNDDEAVRSMNAFLVRMRRKYGCAIVMLHHTKKRTETRKTLLGLEDVHGSVFITAEADSVMIMEPLGDDIIINLAKIRLASHTVPFIVSRNENLAFIWDEMASVESGSKGVFIARNGDGISPAFQSDPESGNGSPSPKENNF